MLIGNAPCSWGINYPTGNSFTWEQYLDQVAAAGYRGTELGPFGFLPTDAGQLGDELAKRGLTLIGATHVHTFSRPATAGDFAATISELSALLVRLRAKHLVIMDESNAYPPGGEGVLDDAGWKAMLDMIATAQKIAEGEHGLKLSFHPHVLTAVEYESQIDRLLAESTIDLCFDTGHHAFRQQVALGYMERNFGRIAYMHLKNVDPAVVARVASGSLGAKESFAQGAMCPLPDGAVDIAAVMALLAARGFAGPVVVEQDMAEGAAESPEALSRRNLAYLQGIAR